ncbi:uncharacterized protein G2W53_027119 [Senna tora]|uniref:Uncharacterized protein n=1 Tax=Senna tora TaxID=362788 RepID=A0A834TIE2_9FABA|nr:uncharacterized protein G2W53_027119 [Senna tora]
MTQGSLRRSFKKIRVDRPTVDHVDRRPSKINESWVNFFSMQNLTCICWVKMKPMTQGKLLRSFKAIQLARSQIFDGRRRGWPSVVVLSSLTLPSPHFSNFPFSPLYTLSPFLTLHTRLERSPRRRRGRLKSQRLTSPSKTKHPAVVFSL